MTGSRSPREPGSPHPQAQHQTGSLDETLASLGDGECGGEHDELPLDRGDLVGRYVVLEEVGHGAMGLVVAAYDPELDRKVALKLMYVPPGVKRGASARLLREAQAMARLAHPNVITVHDVGTAGDDVFIAMEFIEGGSLRDWLRDQAHSWEDIVRVFLQAGEGLAAAHRQGIVHRDFKPDNVLVREDGRVCVCDFGLARQDESASASVAADALRSTMREHSAPLVAGSGSGPGPGPGHELGLRPGLAAGGLTLTGAAMGTPAYMAPEQHRRLSVDHRCDQFAFCVALWEALAGERPYAGATLGAIAFNVTTGRREPFPRDSPVPARVRALLSRGLSIPVEDRFETMDLLLAELRSGLRRARARSGRSSLPWIVAGLGALGLIAAGLMYSTSSVEPGPASAPTLCSRADEQLSGVWDPALRAAVARAFVASDQPFSQRSFERAADQLDGMREAWIDSHTQACEATRVYGEQSEELLDRRMSCLAQRRGELVAVSAALVAAEPETVKGVDDLLATIAPISSCDDIVQLEAGVAAPSLAQREQVEALRMRAAELEVLRRSANAEDLGARAASLVADAEAQSYDPVLAETLHLQAALLESSVGPSGALPVARRAVTVAARSGHRLEVARSLALVAWLEGTGRANFDVGLWLLDQAEAELAALGEPVMLALQVKSDRAAIFTTQGEYEAGLAHFERALSFAERELGPEHMRAADLRFNIAATQHYLGHHEQAKQAFATSLEVYTKLVGADHPEVAQCHNNLAATLAALGEADEAERHARRAIEIWEANGAHSYLNGAYGNLGDVAALREDYEQALAMYEKSYVMKIEVFGGEHPTTLTSLGSLAHSELKLGRYDEAEAHLEQGIARLSEIVDVNHPVVLDMRLKLAEVAHLRGDRGEALELLAELEAMLEDEGEGEGEGDVTANADLRASLQQLRSEIEAEP